MNLVVVALTIIALVIFALALRIMWRTFIRATDEAIDEETNRLRRRGFLGGTRGDHR